MDNELKPCPFCGGTKLTFRPGFMSREVTHIILCLDCDISAGEYHTLPELIEAWNRRPDPWTRIDPADPATLPPAGKLVLAAVKIIYHYRRGDETGEIEVYRTVQSSHFPGEWRDGTPYELPAVEGGYAIRVKHYAWQPWPDPPPYPADNQEDENQ